MSLLSTVHQAVKSYKEEQAKLHGSIQLLNEILQSLTWQPKACSEELKSADDVAGDIPPGEREDMELLDQALEKALRIRSGSESSNKDCGKNLAGPHKKTDTSLDVMHSSTASKESQRAMRLTSKLVSLDRKTLSSRPSGSCRPGKSETTNNRKIIQNHPTSSVHQTSRKLRQAVLTSASPDEITTLLTKNKTVRSNMPNDDSLSKAASVSMPFSNNKLPTSDADWSGASSLPQQNKLPPEQTTKWKSLRSKQNRLWEKFIALQRKPVPERSHFMERMRAMFPREWPCGSPDQTRTLLNRLTHQVLDLTQRCQAEELLAKRASEMATDLDAEHKYDSCLTLERLQLTVAELQVFANQMKQEWKAWDRWRPEGGCLCPSGANGVWADGITSPLPLTITYRAEAELQELERLRMRVALLQQENFLEQVLLDTLSPQFSSLIPGPERPNPSVLRDMYSLLGEGGERFPAIILDSEPE